MSTKKALKKASKMAFYSYIQDYLAFIISRTEGKVLWALTISLGVAMRSVTKQLRGNFLKERTRYIAMPLPTVAHK